MRTEDFSSNEKVDSVYSELRRMSERFLYTFSVKLTVK